ncbi:unnamed protein product [Heligmosomoides polygyrus]|uniref:DUOXA-like protein C06E1.3 n=1 Tax=Heligmosomoides polygyrus TaxID=6339 RepID=A0A183FLQ7_HELPZ|nr:unnamed protein product [Heligmosomoides polygyrus]
MPDRDETWEGAKRAWEEENSLNLSVATVGLAPPPAVFFALFTDSSGRPMWTSWFGGFAEPSDYANAEMPHVNIQAILISSIFVIPYLAFLVILPGVREKRIVTLAVFTVVTLVGAVLAASMALPGWTGGSANILAQLRSHVNERMRARVGVNVGLKSINITLRFEEMVELDLHGSRIDMSRLYYNENFDISGGFFADNSKKGYTSEYARVYSRSEKIASALPDALWSPKSGMCQSINPSRGKKVHRSCPRQTTLTKHDQAAARHDVPLRLDDYTFTVSSMAEELRFAYLRGLPYPILSILEYFSLNQDAFDWGRHYRTAGHYTSAAISFALACWALAVVFLLLVPHYFGMAMLATGLSALFSCLLYLIMSPCQLQIGFVGSQGNRVVMKMSFQWAFYCVFAVGRFFNMKVELREHGFAFEGNEPESNVSGLLALLVGLLLILLQHYRVYTLSTFLGARLDEDVVPIKCRQEQLGQDLPNSLQVSAP